MLGRIAVVFAVSAVLALALPALAGPPAICHPVEIEKGAESLPWGWGAFKEKRGYSKSRVVGDTVAVLDSEADVLNADLVKAGIYDKNEQKLVTAWLGARNSAAHGKYDEYNSEQVKHMLEGIRQFMARHSA